MWKVTLLFSRSTLSSKLLKTSYDSLVLKMHAQGKGAGRAEEPGSRRFSGGGFPPALPGGARPRRRRPRPRPGPPVPGRSSSFKGRRAPLARQLVRSEVTTQESVASWGGILTISATRRRHATQRLAHRSGGWLGSVSAGGRDLGGLTTVPKMPCGVRHGAYHHARSRGGITGRGA